MIRRLLVAAVAGLAAFAAVPAVAQAHPLGNFTVNRYSLVQLERGSVHVTFVLDEAEIPTFQDIGGQPTAARARAWALAHVPAFASKLHLTVNGSAVPLVPDTSAVTATVRMGQGGLHCLRVTVPLSAPISGQGPFTATFTDDTFGSRVGWKEVVMRAAPGAVLTQSSAATHDVSDMLRHYPSGMLSTPLDVRMATFGYRYGTGTSISVGAPGGTGGESVAVSGGAFTDLVTHRELGLGFILVAIGIAMFWGAVHALSPGHGKTMVAAYLVGTRGTARHAVGLGATVTITHTIGVFALGLVALLLAQFILPEQLYPWLSLASALLVLGIGVTVLRSRLRTRGHGHHHHHHEAPSKKSIVAMGASAGLLPCPSALVVLLAALAQHQVPLGIGLILVFSLGLAATLTCLGLVVVYAQRLSARLKVGSRVTAVLPALSSLAIVAIGVVMTVKALPQVA
jgi:nickel/cobalt transporter (NicO) family protein